MKKYEISEKFKEELIVHFMNNYPMAKVEKTVNMLRNLQEIKTKEIT